MLSVRSCVSIRIQLHNRTIVRYLSHSVSNHSVEAKSRDTVKCLVQLDEAARISGGRIPNVTKSKFAPEYSRISNFSEQKFHWHVPVLSPRQRLSSIAALNNSVHVLSQNPLGLHSYWGVSDASPSNRDTGTSRNRARGKEKSWLRLDGMVPFEAAAPQLMALPKLDQLALFIPLSRMVMVFDPAGGQVKVARITSAGRVKKAGTKEASKAPEMFRFVDNLLTSGSSHDLDDASRDQIPMEAMKPHLVEGLASDESTLLISHGEGTDAVSIVNFEQRVDDEQLLDAEVWTVYAPSGVAFGTLRPVGQNAWIIRLAQADSASPSDRAVATLGLTREWKWYWFERNGDNLEFSLSKLSRSVSDANVEMDLLAPYNTTTSSISKSSHNNNVSPAAQEQPSSEEQSIHDGVQAAFAHDFALAQQLQVEQEGSRDRMQVVTYPRDHSAQDQSNLVLSRVLRNSPNQLFSIRESQTESSSNTTVEVVDLTDKKFISVEPVLWEPHGLGTDAKVCWKAATELESGEVVTLETAGASGLVRLWQVNQEALVRDLKVWRQMLGWGEESKGSLALSRAGQGGESTKPPKIESPKHGKEDEDNDPHVGGNTWAGGTGGSNTAGLGGRGGPYRLDKGHPVHQVSEAAKAEVDEETQRKAREMGKQALQERLREIEMSDQQHEYYQTLYDRVEPEIAQVRQILESAESKAQERTWLRNQSHGDLDDSKLVDGATGEKLIYKRRGIQDPIPGMHDHSKPKRMRFVVDCSGSMYRFNGQDGRLERECELVVLLMEALSGFDTSRYLYSIVGHSGEDEAVPFVDYGEPPTNRKERLEVILKMVAHSQFCWSGDKTLEATEAAIEEVVEEEADEYFVMIISDANLRRYGIHPSELGKRLVADERVKAYAIFVASIGEEAERIRQSLPAGRGYTCFDTSELPKMFRQVFTSQLI